MILRDAEPADEAAWRGLWAQYLAFYSVDLDGAITDFTWQRLMDDRAALKARLAVGPDGLLGFAIHQHHASTWVMGDDCYLEDLFVDPKARGAGVGRALIDDLMQVARVRGWKRLYWHTDHKNAQARRLYDSYVNSDGHVRYRLPL
jgi:GNAT superfamily N-acetyltransferase